jgi:hypothetical protein
MKKIHSLYGKVKGLDKAGRTRLKRIWITMKSRCHSPNDQAFSRYGARGIFVCDEWRTSLEAFELWANGAGYNDELQLDRKDNDKGYSPENCRWVSCRENNRNRRSNHLLTIFGETKTVVEWAEDSRCQVAYGTFKCRITDGWNPEEALGPKVDVQVSAFGETKNIIQWSNDPRCTVNRHTLAKRLRAGWDGERAIATQSQKQ